MKRISLVIALVPFLLLPAVSRAVVDMKNANYSDSWLDITASGTGFDLKVQRFYNSRSIFSGMFGFGWCSDFETALTKTPEGNLKYQECGAGQEILYTRGKSDAKEVDETINKIVAFVKKTNRTATAQYIERLTQQLRDSVDLRNRKAKEAGLKDPELKKGTVYHGDNLAVEQITWNGENYVRSLSDGTQQKFDDDGRLVVLSDKNGNFVKLAWNAGLLKEVVDNGGRKLTFQHYPNKRVKEISGPQGMKAEYKFEGEDLISIKNMWKNLYTYKYDSLHNLVRVNFPDSTFKALTYNTKNDWVTSFQERKDEAGAICKEDYTYEFDKKEPKNHFWATAVKKCGTEVRNQSRFEFWHKVRPDGRKYLARVLTKSNTEQLDINYHPEFGGPISIRKNSMLTTFKYYPNGLVQEKSTPNAKMTFEYKNALNKVSKVGTEFFDDKGKPLRKRDTTFDYDTKGNLTFAKNSDGQTVKLSYDTRGRIATILDQAKKEVLIKYDERTNKPSVITRPSVGSIVVTYKDNEIKKVESKEGPSVAVQVASTFNNLLDIIAPATSELSL